MLYGQSGITAAIASWPAVAHLMLATRPGASRLFNHLSRPDFISQKDNTTRAHLYIDSQAGWICVCVCVCESRADRGVWLVCRSKCCAFKINSRVNGELNKRVNLESRVNDREKSIAPCKVDAKFSRLDCGQTITVRVISDGGHTSIAGVARINKFAPRKNSPVTNSARFWW